MDSGSKVLLGILAGAATGAILGVLFAPDKGEETRRRIADGSQDFANNFRERFGDFVDGAVTKYESVKESANELLEQSKAKVATVANGLKSSAENVAS